MNVLQRTCFTETYFKAVNNVQLLYITVRFCCILNCFIARLSFKVDEQVQRAFADLVDNPIEVAEEELPVATPVNNDIDSLLIEEFEQVCLGASS